MHLKRLNESELYVVLTDTTPNSASRNQFKYGGARRNKRLGKEQSLLNGGNINEQID
ncbi:hypothetical protein [Microcoleus sp. EPA2]|uniref:hypothetical protein n=1 Tax=Microcoleus sp. EPA2 TaxID=2841654 RepID=UPI00312B7BDD